jgi:hypothetical protein
LSKFFSHLASNRIRLSGDARRIRREQNAGDLGERCGNHVKVRRAGEQAIPEVEGLEQQQALLLSALRRAAGAPVSYAELRDAGVEFPASVVSELELVGVPIERSYGGTLGERRVVGVRLDPARDPVHAHPESAIRDRPAADRPIETTQRDPTGWNGVRVYRASTPGAFALAALDWLSKGAGKGDRALRVALAPLSAVGHISGGRVPNPHGVTDPEPAASTAGRADAGGRRAIRGRAARTAGRWAAPVALLTTIALVSAFMVIEMSGGGGHPRRAVGSRARTRPVAAGGGSHGVSHPRPATQSPPTPVSPVLATDLEVRGHGLLEVGRYGDAVQVLKRAVLATGERVTACLEPDSSTCLTYAYALYDLGRALRLSGDTTAAVPILERRLRMDNQRSVVQAELQLARQGIG